MLTKQLCSLVLALTTLSLSAQAQWVATWASSQQQPRPTFVRPPTPPAGSAATPPATPAQPPTPPPTRPPRSFNNQTVRMVMRASIGGNSVRVHLSNAFGSGPLYVGSVHIALRDKESAIVPASDHPLTFGGKSSVTIPLGAEMISDPVALDLKPLAELAVSVFVPNDSGAASTHALGLHTTWVKSGDVTSAPDLADGEKLQSWFWVSGIDVQAPDSAAIVALGDSITDGATSTPDTDSSWPSFLSQRLVANPATAKVAIVNQGISGNQVLGDGAGVSALARFDRDVLAQPGVKWLMILEGINDMNIGTRPPNPNAPPPPTIVPPLSADDLIGAMKQMVLRAHDHGIKVIGCTLTPFGNATDQVEAMRQALNAFIRTPGSFDAVVDFDQVIRDPADQRQFRAGYNKTDKLHPNDAGYKAMADAIDLSLFTTKPTTTSTKKK
jgi:lysophospholipase L1-like esterase